MNINCVICSDLFVSVDDIFATPCGHIFHHVCLIQWMERKKDCPQCRQKCTSKNIIRLYLNNIANLDSTTNTANLIENIDNMTLQLREKEVALKKIEEGRNKLEDDLNIKNKKIKKLENTVATSNQIIATMRHEIDILSTNKASYKILEAENNELKSKLDLMQTVESILTASQKEVDDILKQNLSSRDLSVIVGTLRRELSTTENRKNELRKQLLSARNDLRVEQEEKKQLGEKLSMYESENHTLMNRLKRKESKKNIDTSIIDLCDSDVNSPEIMKKPRMALHDQNTPSPLTRTEFQKRVANIQQSDSPYLNVKSSSIALTSVLRKPLVIKDQPKPLSKALSADMLKLSIFKKPRLEGFTTSKPNNLVYNGIGGTNKILESDLKKATESIQSTSSNCYISHTKLAFKKKLSADAIKK